MPSYHLTLNDCDRDENAAAFPPRDSNGKGNSINANERLRVARVALAGRLDAGFDVDELMRIGAAVMVERCVAVFDARGVDVKAGWLVAAVRAGGTWTSVQPVAPAAVVPLRFPEYDRAAGLS